LSRLLFVVDHALHHILLSDGILWFVGCSQAKERSVTMDPNYWPSAAKTKNPERRKSFKCVKMFSEMQKQEKN
jgi:hypothetical protein